MNNFEKIKNMSIEEMSENIKKLFCEYYSDCRVCPIHHIIFEHLEEQPKGCTDYLEELLAREE